MGGAGVEGEEHMNCTRCGKWAGAHATLPGQPKDHLCMCQPQREFIGLTDEERDEICLGDEAIARAIEAKLKEKNT